LLRPRLLDSLLRQALQVVLLLRVRLAVAAAVPAADLWQAVAELLLPDSSVPARPD